MRVRILTKAIPTKLNNNNHNEKKSQLPFSATINAIPFKPAADVLKRMQKSLFQKGGAEGEELEEESQSQAPTLDHGVEVRIHFIWKEQEKEQNQNEKEKEENEQQQQRQSNDRDEERICLWLGQDQEFDIPIMNAEDRGKQCCGVKISRRDEKDPDFNPLIIEHVVVFPEGGGGEIHFHSCSVWNGEPITLKPTFRYSIFLFFSQHASSSSSSSPFPHSPLRSPSSPPLEFKARIIGVKGESEWADACLAPQFTDGVISSVSDHSLKILNAEDNNENPSSSSSSSPSHSGNSRSRKQVRYAQISTETDFGRLFEAEVSSSKESSSWILERAEIISSTGQTCHFVCHKAVGGRSGQQVVQMQRLEKEFTIIVHTQSSLWVPIVPRNAYAILIGANGSTGRLSLNQTCSSSMVLRSSPHLPSSSSSSSSHSGSNSTDFPLFKGGHADVFKFPGPDIGHVLQVVVGIDNPPPLSKWIVDRVDIVVAQLEEHNSMIGDKQQNQQQGGGGSSYLEKSMLDKQEFNFVSGENVCDREPWQIIMRPEVSSVLDAT